MKKLLFLFVFLVCSICIYAQRNKDLVYLKNGSIIHGTVIEQNFVEDRINIKATDGSLFVYKMSEVERIERASKEEKSEGFLGGNGLHRKFRIIIEPAYVFGIEDSDYKEDRVGGTVSAGYQFNPYIYLGGGAGGYYYVDSKVASLPIFLNFRADFINARINPFVDVKGGYSPLKDVEGAYASVSVGCRFRLGNTFALSVSAGSELQSAEVKYTYTYYSKYNSYNKYSTAREDIWGVFTKIGIDF